METPDPNPRRRPPDEIVLESLQEDEEVAKRRRPIDEIVSPVDYDFRLKRQRRAVGWSLLRRRFREALTQVRVLIFVHIEDEKECLRVRGCNGPYPYM
jgi:hypothetical protein